jgi:L-ascorbate metabolism protein UlaG (beta-lactamase superfamily)
MRMIKHAHACVTLEKDGGRIVIDPGTLTPNAAELVGSTSVVLVTHEHPDHFDETMIGAALEADRGLRVYGPAAVVDRWPQRRDQVIAVAEGDRFTVEGFDVAVFGAIHARVHPDIPRVANVGYFVDESLYHPGDAYHVPPVHIGTLLLPTSGPWTKLEEAADYVRAVGPGRVVQIHEMMLSELGQQSVARLLSPGMLTSVPLTVVAAGETITV